MLRSATPSDAAAICEIYNQYVASTIVTFEIDPVLTEQMQARIQQVMDTHPWLVWEQDARILGYAYAAQWKSRCAFRYCVESTVYLAPDETGRGLGRKLYQALFDLLRQRNTHTIIAGISLPNPASVALHEKMGFEKIGHFKEVGWKFNKWIDVGYWQLSLK